MTNLILDLYKKRAFSNIFITRNRIKDGSEYYTYAKVRQAKALIDVVKNIYKPEPAISIFSENKINEGKYKFCLEYHIKNCEGAQKEWKMRQTTQKNQCHS